VDLQVQVDLQAVAGQAQADLAVADHLIRK
jgi:hypothetical protein